MKITNYHGSIINAGDFLIQESAKLFLEAKFNDMNVVELSRHSLNDKQSDGLAVYFGGPFISRALFEDTIPLQRHNVVPIGVGVFNKSAEWGKNTKDYFSRISKFFPTGRDYQSTEILRECGCKNAVLGGCPAFIVGDFRNASRLNNFNRIVVSDPSWGINYGYAYHLIGQIQKIFPTTPITFCFHRGIFDLDHKSLKASIGAKLLAAILAMRGVDVIDISGGAKGFAVYDNALHIGFRVHAHVYARSIDRPSILFTEDIRSVGMNGLFGDPLIEPSNIKKANLSNLISRELEKFDKYGSLRCDLAETTMAAISNNLHAL